jgi:hypothetical protein
MDGRHAVVMEIGKIKEIKGIPLYPYSPYTILKIYPQSQRIGID